MTEAVVLVQAGLMYLALRMAAAERRSLMNRIYASNNSEFVALEKATAPKSRKKQEPIHPPIGL